MGGPSQHFIKEHQRQKEQANEANSEPNSQDSSDENAEDDKGSNKDEDEDMNEDDSDSDQEEDAEEEKAQSGGSNNEESGSKNSRSGQSSSKTSKLSERQDDFLLCDKCMRVSKLAKNDGMFAHGEFANIILGNTSIEEYLVNVKYKWSTTRKLYGMMEYDFRVMATWEFSIFEHIMLYRFWYKFIEQSSKNKLHTDLYKDLLDKSQVHMVHNQELDTVILKKLRD